MNISMRERYIIHSRFGEKEEYFFSTDHCQGVKGRGEGTYPEGFVPTTFYLPMTVVPRPCLPSGLVETLEQMILIFFKDAKEIPNPDPRFQPCST
jgi:hypothetical protein